MIDMLNYAQSWTALFRAFSSHRQPSAIFSKVFPAEQTSFKGIPSWTSGSWHGFPGVDHEGRQDVAMLNYAENPENFKVFQLFVVSEWKVSVEILNI